MTKHILIISSLLLLLTACSHPYVSHYRETGQLHPELIEQQRAECDSFGFKEGSKELANCRMELSQNWKNNREAAIRAPNTSFGLGYGFNRGGYGFGSGYRF